MPDRTADGRCKISTSTQISIRAIVSACAVAIALALVPALARAAEPVYVHIGSFGEPGAGPGQLTTPHRLAVDPADGDVLVADTGNSRVEVFRPTASGAEYLFEFGAGLLVQPVGIAIDPSDGDVYVSDAGAQAIVRFRPDDASAPSAYTPDPSFAGPAQGFGEGQVGSFGEVKGFGVAIGGIAVDPATGDLLLADPARALVERFDQEGHFIDAFDGSTSGAPFTRPGDIAVTPAGDVLVADLTGAGARLLEFEPGGGYLATLGPVPQGFASTTGVAIAADAADGGAFAGSKTGASLLAEPSRVYRLGPSGLEAEQIEDPSLGGLVLGMAAAAGPPARLYVIASSAALGGTTRVQAFEAVEPPGVAIEPVDPAGLGAEAASFAGSVDPHGSPVLECAFQYVTEAAYGAEGFAAPQEAACEPPPGDGEGPEAVAASAAGLEPNTSYRVRLRAAGPGGATGLSAVESFTTRAAPPRVVTGAAWSISDTTATLTATVDPRNSPLAGCRFEYGPTSAYGSSVPCASLPAAGRGPVTVSAEIAGLAPSSAYRFRIVATGAVGSEQRGEEGALTTRSAAESELPARGYELVSAADTDGIDPLPIAASTDGDAYVYATYIPSPGSRSGVQSFFRAVRDPLGTWSQAYVTIPPPPPGEAVKNAFSFLFSADDLGTAVLTTGQSLDPADADGVADLYLGRAGADWTWLSRDPLQAGAQTDPTAIGPALYISPDGGRVLFESFRRLLPDDRAAAGRSSLYEWDEGRLSLVGYLPGEALGSQTGSQLGSGAALPDGTSYGAVSADGSRVAFEAPDGEGDEQLYLRLGRSRTIAVSRSAADVTPPVASPSRVTFWGADSAGQVIVFTSDSALTADSAAGGADGEADLYAYDVAEESLHDLTPHAAGGGVRRVYAVSEDGRRVYFTSTRSLIPGQGTPGEANLYLAETGPEGALARPLAFIATVDRAEDADGDGVDQPQSFREAASDADGSVLAFRDRLALVPGRLTGGRPQLYVYEAPSGRLSCASCPGDGSEPTAGANLLPALPQPGAEEPTVGGAIPQITNVGGPHVRNVSAAGAVFFQTANPLVAADTNGRIDVYEWHGGKVGLVSAGAEPHDSIFGGASADGDTVFFYSADGLLPGAQAGVAHIYAARVGGGAPPAQAPAPPCIGADCRGPLPAAAPPPTVGTAGLAGAGEVVRPRHKKHRRRRHRRVRRHHARKAERGHSRSGAGHGAGHHGHHRSRGHATRRPGGTR